MIRRTLLSLLTLLVLGLGVTTWLARHSFVQESEQLPTPWSAKALEDDTLMLERWLALRGYGVRRSGGPIMQSELPPGGTLFLLNLTLLAGIASLWMAWLAFWWVWKRNQNISVTTELLEKEY